MPDPIDDEQRLTAAIAELREARGVAFGQGNLVAFDAEHAEELQRLTEELQQFAEVAE